MSLAIRHQVLEGLGVRQWYGKYTMSNAARTPIGLFADTKTFDDVSKESAVKDTDLVQVVPSLLTEVRSTIEPNLVKEALDSEVLAARDEVSKITSNVDDTALIKDLPRITISAMSLGEVVIFFEQSESSDEDLENKLLEAIFSVVSGCKTELSKEVSVLAWPVFESDIFRYALSAYLDLVIDRWLELQAWAACRHVFYFGEHFSRLEAKLLENRSERGLDYKLVHCDVSLAQILASPIKKKNLWELFSQIGIVSG